MMKTSINCAIASLSLLLLTGAASAADINWQAPISGNFNDAKNWLPASVPGSTDTAIFNLGSAGYTVTAFSQTAGQVRIDNDTLTLNALQIIASSPNVPDIQLGSNDGDVANLTLKANLQGNEIWIGGHAGSQATVTIQSGGLGVGVPQSSTPAELVVGAGGTGTLAIDSGSAGTSGKVIVARDSTSHGTFTLTGVNSMLWSRATDLIVGQGGTGSMSVTLGARADVVGAVMVGQDAGSHGNISIDGLNSVFQPASSGTMTSTTVGGSGEGSFSVTGDAKADLRGSLVIGKNAGSQGDVNVDDARLTLRPAGGGAPGPMTLIVAESGTGTLGVTGGALAEIYVPAVIGQNTGASGNVNVEGTDTEVNFFSPLTVGADGSGTLSVKSGGVATVVSPLVVGGDAGSSGSVTVEGAGSKLANESNTGSELFVVGKGGVGQMSITQGGALDGQGSSMIIGADAGSNGSVSLDGAGSTMKLHGTVPGGGGIPSIIVGQNGMGNLSASNGATIDSGQVFVGVKPTGSTDSGHGTLLLSGTGTSLAISNVGGHPSIIGHQTTGAAYVTNGATVTGGRVVIGNDAGGAGAVHVDGLNSRWTASDDITLGVGSGVGSLSITGSGRVTLTNSSTLRNSAGSVVTLQQGTLDAPVVNAGTLINNGRINGNVNSTGTYGGSGFLSGSLTLAGGTISPGNSPGSLVVSSLTMNNSSSYQLDMNRAAGAPGGAIGWDRILSTGSASFGSSLTIDLVSLTAANTPGNVPDFNPNRDYQWSILVATGGIQGFSPGDFTVDTSQFTNAFRGDFFVSQLGNSLLLNYQVPEPSTLWLAGVGALGLVACRWRKVVRRREA